MSISLYILAGYEKNDIKSNEAGIKYFIIGAFSSAIFLFGLSYIYGYAGSTKYYDIANMVANNGITSFNFKIVRLLIGISTEYIWSKKRKTLLWRSIKEKNNYLIGHRSDQCSFNIRCKRH